MSILGLHHISGRSPNHSLTYLKQKLNLNIKTILEKYILLNNILDDILEEVE